MAKKPGTGAGKTKNEMTRVKCPMRGNEVTWANSTKDGGRRCTACGQTGHDRA